MRVVKAGSFAKHTILRKTSADPLDVDVVFYLRDENIDQETYESLGNQIYDFLVSNGIKPFIEVSFMPRDLSSNPDDNSVFYYEGNGHPPADWDAWGDLVTAFTSHLVDRYGIAEVRTWPFEVWNEPNLGFLSNGGADYNQLYKVTATAIKSVNGSPSSAMISAS